MQNIKVIIRDKNLKHYIQSIFTRKITVILLIALQLIAFIFLYFYTARGFAAAYVIQTVMGAVTSVLIVNSSDHPSYKIAWLVPLVVLPGFMSVAYLYLHLQLNRYFFKRCVDEVNRATRRYLKQNDNIVKEMDKYDVSAAHLARYIGECAGYPAFNNTDVKYFKVGEEYYEALVDEIKKAKRYIFMEYFIISNGDMWREIFKLLLLKVSEGVEVRLMYDGMGSASILPGGYDDFLNDNGIKCKVFNRFKPFLTSEQNNRDHRKITVIDGQVAFTGGINLADEYINQKKRFGHWKDSGVMLKGDAVFSFVMMFFQMWELNVKQHEDYNLYRADKKYFAAEDAGYVIPYGDCPNDLEAVGKTVYLDIINKAKDYVYITAPYFVIDNELVTALSYAAKSGVDVKIIVPGIYDKWYVHQMSMCYYRELIPAGVKFYSYTPGFIHAKNFVSDDLKAVVGTVNTDFRSLYLHFEDAVFMYRSHAVKKVKEDFEKTLLKCRELTLDDVNKNVFSRLLGSLIRAFGPLL